MKPEDNTHFELFKDYAREEGIPFDHEDDWICFWETWYAGFKKGVEVYTNVPLVE